MHDLVWCLRIENVTPYHGRYHDRFWTQLRAMFVALPMTSSLQTVDAVSQRVYEFGRALEFRFDGRLLLVSFLVSFLKEQFQKNC